VVSKKIKAKNRPKASQIDEPKDVPEPSLEEDDSTFVDKSLGYIVAGFFFLTLYGILSLPLVFDFYMLKSLFSQPEIVSGSWDICLIFIQPMFVLPYLGFMAKFLPTTFRSEPSSDDEPNEKNLFSLSKMGFIASCVLIPLSGSILESAGYHAVEYRNHRPIGRQPTHYTVYRKYTVH
jgi:hypothetical protein